MKITTSETLLKLSDHWWNNELFLPKIFKNGVNFSENYPRLYDIQQNLLQN